MSRTKLDPEQVLEAIARGEITCGDLAMKIDRDGNWFYHGSKIARPELIRLFASVLHRGGDGSYWLITPAERGRIEVEDAPFTAVELQSEGEGRSRRVSLRTNLGEWVPLSQDHPLETRMTGAGPTPYLLVRGRLEARLLTSLVYHLVELAEPDERQADMLGLWSHGRFIVLGRVAEDADEP